MSSDNVLEARRYPRVRIEPALAGVSVQRVKGDVIRTLEGHAYDVSRSGARIELDEPLRPNERVAFCLRLPGELTGVFASGRIMWANDAWDDPAACRMGLEITRFLSKDDERRLARFIESSAAAPAA